MLSFQRRMMNPEFIFDFRDCVKWAYPLSDGEKKNYLIEPRPLPCEWAKQKLYLISPSYLYPGKFVPWKYQEEMIDAFHYWQNIIFVGPVQSGKSLMAEVCIYYTIAVLHLNFMVAFANEKKSADAFEDRYVKMIRDQRNPALYDSWDKKDDSLTKGKLKLINCIGKIASARNKNDMASFTGPVVYGSEVAKWFISELGYDPVLLLRGRSDAAFALYNSRKCILESSPYEEGDLLYNETFRNGTLVLQPYYKCPHCNGWQTLTDSQIKLRDKSLKGEPAKIRELKEEAVYYECELCNNEITESQRVVISDNAVWAKAAVEEEGFKQEAEKIDQQGKIAGRREGGVRSGYDAVAYWYNRLSDVTFPFYECLARFFESLPNEQKRKSYENETMTRWRKIRTGRIEEKYIETRKIEYWQWGERHYIPDNVLVITLGADTQDDGFYYSIVGWGQWLSWYVLRQGFIPCQRVEKGYEFQVFEKFMGNLYAEPLRWSDGTFADFTIGGIDRGGHRPDDVDYIIKHFPGGRLFAYVGLTHKYDDREMVYKSDNGDFYLGQSDPLSEDTGKYISGENFYIPMDVDKEFIKQIGRQFHKKKIGTSGEVSVEWVHNYQGPDHYRDSLNINLAAAKIKGIDKMLMDPLHCQNLKVNRSKVCPIPIKKQEQLSRSSPSQQQRTTNRRDNIGYFRNLGGRL
jgi:hypothetical protein